MPLSPPPNRRGRVCDNTGTSTRAEALETPFAALRNGALCRRRSGEKPQRAPGTSTPARKSKSISLLGNAFAANKLAPCPFLGRGVPSFSLLLSALLAHLFCEFMSVLSVARIQTFCYVCFLGDHQRWNSSYRVRTEMQLAYFESIRKVL